MAYRIEGKELIIDGFEKGIADSPYNGIADMRNLQPVSIPNEVSVQFSMAAVAQPPVYNATAFTASASTNRLTVASVAGMYEGVALSLTLASNSVSYLAVAGGGGGAGGANTGGGSGSPGGGGGAGGMKTGTLSSLAVGAYTITVGAGGAKGVGGASGTDGTVGGDSSIAALVVSKGGGGGGGGGQGASSNGNNGGSGGGAGFGNDASTHPGGTATPAGQGNNGGASGAGGADVNSGGGGGAGAVGANGAGTSSGNGGNGLASSISGASVTYAGGGGGGAINTGGSTGTGGTGGTGGGGTGAPTGAPGAGSANTGGGGGGGRGDDDSTNTDGADGGSGIVVLSYTTGSLTATGGTVTTSGGNTIHTFTTSGTFTVVDPGIAANKVYYVRNISGSTFQLSTSPFNSIIDIAVDITGTFTTYQYGNQRGTKAQAPISHGTDTTSEAGSVILLVDGSNYAWINFVITPGTVPANSLVFLGNIGGIGASSFIVSGITIFNEYILLFGADGKIDYMNVESFISDGPFIGWNYSWKTPLLQSLNSRVSVLVSKEDGNVYFGTQSGLGSIIETPGQTFDPGNGATYSYTEDAVSFPETDEITCIAELGQTLLLGGRSTFVYVWDKLSPGFNDLLNIPDTFTFNIVAMNNNAYIFTGVRGRIYITNGSGVEMYKKVPDYVTGIVNPYMMWKDASFDRKQLYFSLTATTNALVTANTVSGAWAIDTDSDALYMLNKTTNTGYTGTSAMVTAVPPLDSSGTPPSGTGVFIGWYSGSTYGVDTGSSTPYSNYESFLHTEIIPVGTYLDPLSPAQIEWKTSAALVNGEAVRVSYRLNLTDAFTVLGTTTYNGTSTTGSTTGVTAGAPFSDYYQANFQKAQWVQFLVETKSTATTPSYVRLTELRLRDVKNA